MFEFDIKIQKKQNYLFIMNMTNVIQYDLGCYQKELKRFFF